MNNKLIQKIGHLLGLTTAQAIEEVRDTNKHLDDSMEALERARQQHREAVDTLLARLVEEAIEGRLEDMNEQDHRRREPPR